jgi:hypothetical protein
VPYVEPSLDVNVTVNGGNINFNTKSLLSGSAYSIMNSMGQTCTSDQITSAQWSVSANNLASGIYLYQIINSSQRVTGKIFIP